MIEREKLVSIVSAVQNGEKDAAAELYNTFHEDIYYYILKTVKDSELAADLTQDTFIEILQTIGSLREPAAFVTWSRRIAYHRCTGYFKKRKDLLADENEDGYSVFDELVEDREEFIPDEALDKEELKKAIQDMVDALPEEQRSAILLRYFDEISVKDIAEIQGVTEGTVKSRLNYARKAIKSAVEEYEKKNGIKLHCKGVVPLLVWLFREYQISNGAVSTVKTASVVHASVEAATSSAGESKSILKTALATLTGKVVAAHLITKILLGVTTSTVVMSSVMSGEHPGYEYNVVENQMNLVKDELEFIYEWDGFDSENLTEHILTVLAGTGIYMALEINGYTDLQEYTGVSDRSLIIDAEAYEPIRDPKYYAALVRVKNPEDVGLVLSQMKENLRPDLWTRYSEQQERWVTYWEDVTVDDLEFYTSEEFILVSYTDPYYKDLGGDEDKRSTKQMQVTLDMIMRLRKEELKTAGNE